MLQRALFSVLALFLVTAGTASAHHHHAPDLPPLVSVEWLAQQIDPADLDSNLVILDIRSAIDGGDRAAFEAGHIPGAIYSSYTEAGWRQSVDGIPGKLPPIDDLEQLIGGLGISNDHGVVIVPAGVGSTDFGSAARIYWTFKLLGHDKVSILNGGYRAWVEAEQPIATGWHTLPATTFSAEFRPELIADTDTVAAARDNGIQLVDNRPVEQFLGRDKHPVARAAGTIPGSLNLEQHNLTEADTAFLLNSDSLQALLQNAEIQPDQQTITFCNTGHWSALGWFALSEVAGLPDVAMYDGSMVEWAQEPNRPLQTERRGVAGLIDRILN